MKKNIYVKNIGFGVLIWLIINRGKVNHVVYNKITISHKLLAHLCPNLVCKKVSFACAPHAFFKGERRLYECVERLVEDQKFIESLNSVLNLFGLDKEMLVLSFKKHSMNILRSDVMFISLINELYINNNKYFIVDEYHILRELCNDDGCFNGVIRLKISRGLLGSFYRIFKLLLRRSRDGRVIEAKFVFEQMYPLRYQYNPEFEAFYRYFKCRDDVLYLCVGKDEIYKSLKREGKNVATRDEITLGTRQKVDSLSSFIKVCAATIFLKGVYPSCKSAIVRMFYEQLYYRAVFSSFKCKYFLSMRLLYSTSHPVATAVARKYGVGHIGYSCGSHHYHNSWIVYMGFDYYGLLGMGYLTDMFKVYWPSSEKTRYALLGPLTAEADCYPIERSGVGFLVGVFSTTTSDEIWMPDRFFEEFISNICRALGELSVENMKVIFKEKDVYPWRESIINQYATENGLNHEIGYSNVGSGELCYNSLSVLKISDLSIVMAGSTVSWEAVNLQKKLLIYEQDWNHHPFEDCFSEMVVRDLSGTRKSMKYILGMDDASYRKKISEINQCWGHRSQGGLVKEFIEGIEKAEIRYEKDEHGVC